tara:strand:- start:17820 stop:17942 length:123 start_codon:yes stop_codon:yes gene_type:complete
MLTRLDNYGTKKEKPSIKSTIKNPAIKTGCILVRVKAQTG